MTQHSRPTDGPEPLDLEQQIARALHSRATTPPDADVVAAHIETRLAAMADGAPTGAVRRGGRLVATGLVASTIAVGAAGAAAATNPYSGVARAVETVAQSVGIEWSAMPDNYSREQHEAFWDSGYDFDDALLLADQWQVDMTETKARLGQLALDGEPLPEPEPLPDTPENRGLTAREAFWDAGYDASDAEVLVELWNVDYLEVKTRVGQMILDGQPLPPELQG